MDTYENICIDNYDLFTNLQTRKMCYEELDSDTGEHIRYTCRGAPICGDNGLCWASSIVCSIAAAIALIAACGCK